VIIVEKRMPTHSKNQKSIRNIKIIAPKTTVIKCLSQMQSRSRLLNNEDYSLKFVSNVAEEIR